MDADRLGDEAGRERLVRRRDRRASLQRGDEVRRLLRDVVAPFVVEPQKIEDADETIPRDRRTPKEPCQGNERFVLLSRQDH